MNIEKEVLNIKTVLCWKVKCKEKIMYSYIWCSMICVPCRILWENIKYFITVLFKGKG